MITLATAHPAKFSEAITVAGLDLPELPAHLADLFEREERYSVIANDSEKSPPSSAQRSASKL